MDAREYMRVGLAAHAAGRHDEAAAAYRRVLASQPDNADALHNLGLIMLEAGHTVAASEFISRAVTIRPGMAEFRNSLGVALQKTGDHLGAIPHFRKALQRQADHAQAHCNLGDSLVEVGRLDEALASYRRAIAFRPAFALAHEHLGSALVRAGATAEAIAAFREALKRDERRLDARLNLAALLHSQGEMDEAQACYQRLLELVPGDADAHNNMAHLLADKGDPRGADAHYRQALALRPGFVEAHSNFLLNLNYLEDLDGARILAEHRVFDERHARALTAAAAPHSNSRDADRRLRVGYVSPDLREHAVARFLEPVLEQHAREEFEIYCYSLHPRVDATTKRLQAMAAGWRDLAAMGEAEAAAAIRGDRIDILVDLAGHTAYNRILIFARRPAPVQITWLGYMCTTGLAALDYRISDALCDPPGAESLHSERLLRLDRSQWCYRPAAEPAVPGPLPAQRAGALTFASFNHLGKVNDAVVATWAEVLKTVPGSRMLVARVAEGDTQARLLARFAHHGIEAQRLRLVGKLPWSEYLGLFDEVDVVLDTFPYAGTTTTCEALSLGLPVISLAGDRSIARSGVSILEAVGLGALVATSRESYVAAAAALARDLPALERLRRELPQRVVASSLTDASSLARGLEGLYRSAWERWCRGASGPGL